MVTGAMVDDMQSSGLVERLATDHRVLAFDRPGFGLSDRPSHVDWTPELEAEILSEALTMLGVQNPVIVGHSSGTLTAINLALREPAAVKALVLLSGYYVPTARLDVALQTPVSMPIVGDLLRLTVMALAARLTAAAEFGRMFSPLPVSPKFLAAYPVGLACRPVPAKVGRR